MSLLATIRNLYEPGGTGRTADQRPLPSGCSSLAPHSICPSSEQPISDWKSPTAATRLGAGMGGGVPGRAWSARVTFWLSPATGAASVVVPARGKKRPTTRKKTDRRYARRLTPRTVGRGVLAGRLTMCERTRRLGPPICVLLGEEP